jgi:hypothetical protein
MKWLSSFPRGHSALGGKCHLEPVVNEGGEKRALRHRSSSAVVKPLISAKTTGTYVHDDILALRQCHPNTSSVQDTDAVTPLMTLLRVAISV